MTNASAAAEATTRLERSSGPVERVWPRVVKWLETEPDRIAKELLLRLQVEGQDAFGNGQLRTFQGKVKDWRAAAARRLVPFTDDFAD